MSFDQLARFRRSCRQFDAVKDVDDSLINKVIDAGLYAPTAKNNQNVKFIVIKNKVIRDHLSKINSQLADFKVDMFYGAPVVILVVARKSQFAVYDGSCAIENMLLEASDIGLGACWIHRAKEELLVDEVKSILKSVNLDANEFEGIGHVILGHPAKDRKTTEKQILANRVFWIK